MIQQLELVLLPEEAADKAVQLQKAAQALSVSPDRIKEIRVLRRSIDARSRKVRIRLLTEVFIDEHPEALSDPASHFHFSKNVSKEKKALIIGCGPAGMFAALRLIELGIKPIIIERGKDVRKRRHDLAAINKQGIVNPESNYCFGEGGAGTYSDGKLYTRSGKRGDINRILNAFVLHGANPDILIDAHPHIGTNQLPKVVQAMRETILQAGGEIFFEHKLEELLFSENKIRGIRVKSLLDQNSIELLSEVVILATGHSARDVFSMLDRQGIRIEAKAFALGVRIEHPQEIIDAQQYHCEQRSAWLPPASYSLTTQANGRGVYSFCMCPGGIIAPAATNPGEIVVNGWSPSKRNNPYANSGMVVSVGTDDFENFREHGALAGMYFQESVEKIAYQAGGGKLRAPAQRLIDFTRKKISSCLPDCSYIPGIVSSDLYKVLPEAVSQALQNGLLDFGKRMKSYFTNEAVLVATESRTSSPVRIPRNKENLQHPELEGLFPCAEGAGYAGGIVSAAMDGERCAEAAIALL